MINGTFIVTHTPYLYSKYSCQQFLSEFELWTGEFDRGLESLHAAQPSQLLPLHATSSSPAILQHICCCLAPGLWAVGVAECGSGVTSCKQWSAQVGAVSTVRSP